jgi:hypothetical protein
MGWPWKENETQEKESEPGRATSFDCGVYTIYRTTAIWTNLVPTYLRIKVVPRWYRPRPNVQKLTRRNRRRDQKSR